MRLLLLGDVHEDIASAKKILDSASCDFVLQTGDLGAYCSMAKPMYFIAGNHEDWGILNAMDRNEVKFKNLHHIETAEIIKLTKKGNKEALVLSGINGNFSPKRYETGIKDRERHFTRNDIERCKRLKGIDVFLSHEAPVGIGFIKRNKDVGVEPVKEILDSVRPGFFIFCHHHMFFEKTLGATRIIGLGYASMEYCILDTNNNRVDRIRL